MVMFELRGKREFNRLAISSLRLSKDEAEATKLADIIAPSQYYRTLRYLLSVTKKEAGVFTSRARLKNGREIELEVNVARLGRGLFSAICTDISGHLKNEREMQERAAAFESFLVALPYPYAIFANRKLAASNAAFRALFPWVDSAAPSLSEFLGRRNADLLREVAHLLEQPGVEPSIRNREILIPAPRRPVIATEVSVSAVPYKGMQALYFTFVDVSERRNVLDAAESAEKNFTSLVESSPDPISISVDGKLSLVNRKFAEMLGWGNPMEMLGKESTAGVSGRNARDAIRADERRLLEGSEGLLRYEYIGRRKDGKKITVEAVSTPVHLDGKRALLTYHRDVTSQRELEATLDRRARGFGILNTIYDETAKAGDRDALYHLSLTAALKATGFDAGGLFVVDRSKREMHLHYHRGLRQQVLDKLGVQSLDEGLARFFEKSHEPVVTTIDEYPSYLHHKSLFEAEGYKTLAFVPVSVDNQLYAVLILAADGERGDEQIDRTIFEALARQLGASMQNRVSQEQAVAANARFHATVEQIADVLYTFRPDGSFEYVSPNMEKLLGYRPADFLANANLWRTLVHPDDRPLLSQRVTHQTKAGVEFQLEYRILPKGKATYIWLRDTFRYDRDGAGGLLAVHGILHDVSDAHRLAGSSTSSAGDIAALVKNLPVGVAAFTPELTCVAWNIALEKLTRIAHDDVLGKSVHDLPVLRQPVLDLLEKSKAGEQDVATDTECEQPQTEHTIALHLRVVPWEIAEAQRGALILVSPAADLRQLKSDISESEETLRDVIDAMGDALLISDLEGQVWEVNNEFTRLTGYTREEVRMTAFPYPWFPDEEMATFIRWIADLDEKHHLHDLDMTWVHKDGKPVAVSLNTTLLRNLQGKPTAILNIARDISERRKLSLALERTNRQFELLNKIISHANTTTDLDQIFEKIATEILTLVRFDGMSISFAAGGRELDARYDAVPTGTGKTRHVEGLALDDSAIAEAVRIRKPVIRAAQGTDTVHGTQISIPLLVNENALGSFTLVRSGKTTFGADELAILHPVADQIGAIIQRVRLFQQVRNDSTYIHNLLNSIDNVVYTVDRQYRVSEVNKAWSEFMIRRGMPQWANEEQIVGQPLQVIFPDAVWSECRKAADDLFARRIERYSRDMELTGTPPMTHHLVINPMVIDDTVIALVFTHTDITEINRTEAELKRRNRELLALNAIVGSINTSLEVSSVMSDAVEQLREAFGADIVAFYLVDDERRRLQLAGQWGIPPSYVDSLGTLDIDASLAGQAIATRSPVYVTDNLTKHPRLAEEGRKMYTELGLRSGGIIPLQSKDRIRGAFVITFAAPHQFSESEQQLLVLIGNQIGAAVENAQLYEEVQQQVNTLTTLYELGKGLTGALDLSSMLQAVYREVARALPFERFYYQAYFPEHESLSLLSRTVNGVSEYYPAGVKVRGLADWPNNIYLNVVAHGTSYVGSTASELTDSILAVPIKSDNKVIGIISILTSVPNAYKTTHLRLLESIANLTGVAIGKALLYEDTLKKSAELENRNKELDDFTYVVSHDLKEPLISIEGYSKIVMKDYKDKLDAEGVEYLGAVVQSTTRMKHLIEDLLTLSRLGRMPESTERVSVKKIIDEILHDLQFSLRERNVTVQVADNLPEVQYSGTRLSMVFRNLISNAMKFNDKPAPVIDIGVRDAGSEHEFFVADNGIGIDPQYFQRIFTIFQRLKRSEEFRGTGAGLTIAKKIVEMDGGRIWVTSTPGQGSTFSFTIKKPV